MHGPIDYMKNYWSRIRNYKRPVGREIERDVFSRKETNKRRKIRNMGAVNPYQGFTLHPTKGWRIK